ncbi:hypothetical protein [Prochlorococcus marinus]|uniref:hypothetical protein n=1 Tax=Prochlorococcus marinus TaxID=1219 RepID=UPI0039B0BFFB
MDTSKVIITNQKRLAMRYSFENEVGLSSYDLALISFNKITRKSKSYIKDPLNTTFLI